MLKPHKFPRRRKSGVVYVHPKNDRAGRLCPYTEDQFHIQLSCTETRKKLVRTAALFSVCSRPRRWLSSLRAKLSFSFSPFFSDFFPPNIFLNPSDLSQPVCVSFFLFLSSFESLLFLSEFFLSALFLLQHWISAACPSPDLFDGAETSQASLPPSTKSFLREFTQLVRCEREDRKETGLCPSVS